MSAGLTANFGVIAKFKCTLFFWAHGIISTAGLARTFPTKRGPVEAVRGIDLTVQPGEILGFLGPNGAGKTTTLRMLTTLLAPTGGAATSRAATWSATRRDVRRASVTSRSPAASTRRSRCARNWSPRAGSTA